MHFFITYTSNLRANHRSGEDRAPLVQVNGIVEAEVLVHPRDRLHLLLRQVEIHDRHVLGNAAWLRIKRHQQTPRSAGFIMADMAGFWNDADTPLSASPIQRSFRILTRITHAYRSST